MPVFGQVMSPHHSYQMSERPQVSRNTSLRVFSKGRKIGRYFRSGGELLVMAFRKYMTSHGPRTLREGPETTTEWKSESVTDGWTLEGRWRRC